MAAMFYGDACLTIKTAALFFFHGDVPTVFKKSPWAVKSYITKK